MPPLLHKYPLLHRDSDSHADAQPLAHSEDLGIITQTGRDIERNGGGKSTSTKSNARQTEIERIKEEIILKDLICTYKYLGLPFNI